MEKNNMGSVKTFDIPIQSKKRCEDFNKEYRTEYKSTEEHIEKVIDSLYEMITEVGNVGGWYVGDSFEIEIKVKYCPEDK
jgi:hypothetical protein